MINRDVAKLFPKLNRQAYRRFLMMLCKLSGNIVNLNNYYFRTRGGAEVDLIITGSFGVLPIEIKYGSTVKRSSLKSLTAFVKDNKLPMGMLINQGEQIEWLTPEIVQVPARWL